MTSSQQTRLLVNTASLLATIFAQHERAQSNTMLALHLLLLRVVLAVQDADRTCYSSVLLHRDETILPSTDLFCVIRSNEVVEHKDVPIIETEEQWAKYLIENPEIVTEQLEPSSPPLLLVRRGNEIVEFVLPVAFTASKCTGTQRVVLGHTQSISCSPSFYPFNETECTFNEFLSAQRLFEPVIVSYIKNITLETSFRSNDSFLPVQWQQNQCQNVLQEVSMEFVLNGTHVSDAFVSSIRYANLAISNYSTFTQKFDVSFKNVLDSVEKATEKGYAQGQQISGLKEDGSSILLSLPKPGSCRSDGLTPVKFLVNVTSGCTIRLAQCEQVQQQTQEILAHFVPTWIEGSPGGKSANISNALVIHRNRSDAESTTSSGCTVTTEHVVTVHYAKQGTTKNAQNLIVAVTYDSESEKIALTPETIVLLRFAVQFKDVTPSPSFRFAALPHIDIRLPNDFFYPFLSKSAASLNIFATLFIFVHL